MQNNSAKKRLLSDYQRLQKDDPSGFLAVPNEEDIMTWEAVIFGPEDTPWDGGCFKLTVKFSDDFPNKAPNVVFITKMFHPNIYNDGRICLDILDKEWSPIYDIQSILTSIQSLLTDPNPKSPANLEAAKLYSENIQQYYKRVKDCVDNSIN